MPKRKVGKVHELYGQRVRFCAVYAVGLGSKRRPVTFDYSHTPEKYLAVAWVVEWKLARRIIKRCHAILDKANKRIDEDWFDIDAEWAKRVIATAAQEEGIPLFTTTDVKACEIDRASSRFDAIVRRFSLDIGSKNHYTERSQ